MEEKRPLDVVLCAVRSGNRLLMLRRNKPPYKNYWGMPGGKIAFGEHVEDAAVREAREETGLDVKFVGIRGIASEIVHNKGAKKDHFMLYVCELATDDRTFKEGQEGDLKWFDLQEIDAYAKEITPSDLLMIKKFILSKQSVPVYKVKMIEDGEGYFVESFA